MLHKYLLGHGKKIGGDGFDLGTEILEQGRRLKVSKAEKITDKVIEKKTLIIQKIVNDENNGTGTSMVYNIY